jgi:biopolymer transport protein ExbB
VSQSANAWWHDDWAFRKELSFNLAPAGADIAENTVDVPVLVRLSLANFTYFTDAKPDGSDFRFIAADDKTPLKFHIEKYDPQAQIALVWLRMPQLTGGADKTDKVYLYYGNPKATAASDAPGSYDASQALVYHFGSPQGTPQDSGSFKNEPAQLTAELTAASLIGSGLRFSGDQMVTVNASPSLQFKAAQGITLSAWIRPEGGQQQAQVATLEDGARSLVLGIDGSRAYARWRDGGKDVVAQQSADLAAGLWHHIALRVGGGQLALIVDGAAASQVAVSVGDLNGKLSVGAAPAGTNRFVGDLDELQISNVARSDGWIRAAARSQGMDAPLLVYGGDAQKESGASQSYFASTLRNVTVDGWAIIGVLAVMFVASLLIMLFKMIYLNRVAAGNAKFLAEFHRMRDDPAALERREGAAMGDSEDSAFDEVASGSALKDDGSAFGSSTLWRLYHHGMRETLKRLDAKTGNAPGLRTLSPQAIEAIRATMDASQTRMGQGLGAQMVWLTISISGGPFLGLLGTVVGVMITFAAIAAAGEVNVNAIAPGTAAALVATVAGLAVAIPCLFGYNYLNTRIKEITTDMRVFVDEFVTRIAETYT